MVVFQELAKKSNTDMVARINNLTFKCVSKSNIKKKKKKKREESDGSRREGLFVCVERKNGPIIFTSRLTYGVYVRRFG